MEIKKITITDENLEYFLELYEVYSAFKYDMDINSAKEEAYNILKEVINDVTLDINAVIIDNEVKAYYRKSINIDKNLNNLYIMIHDIIISSSNYEGYISEIYNSILGGVTKELDNNNDNIYISVLVPAKDELFKYYLNNLDYKLDLQELGEDLEQGELIYFKNIYRKKETYTKIRIDS